MGIENGNLKNKKEVVNIKLTKAGAIVRLNVEMVDFRRFFRLKKKREAE